MIGSGPNGLSTAITLAQAGRTVLVVEAESTFGGGARSVELTLPGFVHDLCSAVHPLAIGTPFFQSLPLTDYGVTWIHPPAPLAHPLGDGTAVLLERSISETAANLGNDSAAYARLMRPFSLGWPKIAQFLQNPVTSVLRHPLFLARFGLQAIRSATSLATGSFRGERARALFAGIAAHSVLPLEQGPSASFGLVLGAAGHMVGWPIVRGGSQGIANALASCLQSLHGDVVCGFEVKSLDQLPGCRAIFFDTTPRQLARIAGSAFSPSFNREMERFRLSPGLCKVDWALDGPIPWKAAECSRAATVHIGGTLEEIAASERAAWQGQHSDRPFVLLTQPTLFDPTRAPAGKHIAWGYCHVPNGSAEDMSERIESQVERFAPGFKRLILQRKVMTAPELSAHNANLVGGDISGGAATLGQLLFRPTWRWHRTPAKNIFLCSSSTLPGGGVHGLCGVQAARSALRSGIFR